MPNQINQAFVEQYLATIRDLKANVYKRPACEQNFEKHRRERQAFALDCEMFPKVRGLIVARSEATQSQAELDECTAAIAWLDAKMGAI